MFDCWDFIGLSRSERHRKDAPAREFWMLSHLKLGSESAGRPASKDVSTEVEEATALEAVSRRQPVKTQHTEKTWSVL
jgi:hypothetical protein